MGSHASFPRITIVARYDHVDVCDLCRPLLEG
jgi:hypothetical protein